LQHSPNRCGDPLVGSGHIGTANTRLVVATRFRVLLLAWHDVEYYCLASNG
jgi:hypothetical protein